MNLLKTSLLIMLPFILLSSCKSYKAVRKNSFEQIAMLQNNTLLVRLNSSQNKIKALKAVNEFGEAEETRRKEIEENEKTILAFKNNYNFSRVYFFDPIEAHKLKDKKFNQVELFDSNNEIVSDNAFLKDGYLVATFGNVYQDLFIYEGEENARTPIGGTNGKSALVILDEDYIQLRKPFPFRVIITNNKEYKRDAVNKLNNQLHRFNNKYGQKKFKNAG